MGGGRGAIIFGTCIYLGAAVFTIEFQGSPWSAESYKYDPIKTEDFFRSNLRSADKPSILYFETRIIINFSRALDKTKKSVDLTQIIKKDI